MLHQWLVVSVSVASMAGGDCGQCECCISG